MSNSPIVSVRLPRSAADAIKQAAQQTNTSVSAVVRSSLPQWVHDGLQRGDGVERVKGSNGRVSYRLVARAPAKAAPSRPPAAKPAPRAAVAPAPVADPEPHGFAEHRAWKQRKAKAAHDAKSRVGADGLTGHERERAEKMPPAQRARFVENAKALRKRSAR